MGRFDGYVRLTLLLGALVVGGCDDDEFDDDDFVDRDDVVRVACDDDIVDFEVTIDDRAFLPAQLTISDGDVVRWTNEDVEIHSVTAGDPDDPERELFDRNVDVGESLCLRFDDEGDFDYFCEFHPVEMDNGLIRVE